MLHEGLAEVRVSCGSPCSASVLVSTRTGQTSEPFVDVLAIDVAHERLAVPTPEGVAIYGLWDADDPLVETVLPLSPVAAPVSAFSEAAFSPDGTLRVEYLTGAAYNKAVATIPAPPDGS